MFRPSGGDLLAIGPDPPDPRDLALAERDGEADGIAVARCCAGATARPCRRRCGGRAFLKLRWPRSPARRPASGHRPAPSARPRRRRSGGTGRPGRSRPARDPRPAAAGRSPGPASRRPRGRSTADGQAQHRAADRAADAPRPLRKEQSSPCSSLLREMRNAPRCAAPRAADSGLSTTPCPRIGVDEGRAPAPVSADDAQMLGHRRPRASETAARRPGAASVAGRHADAAGRRASSTSSPLRLGPVRRIGRHRLGLGAHAARARPRAPAPGNRSPRPGTEA